MSGNFEVEFPIENQKDTNHQVLIKSQQNCLKQGVEQFVLRSTNLLILFGKGMTCLIILIGFSSLMKLVRLIKMRLNETYSRVRAGKQLSDMFPMTNGLKLGDASTPLHFIFAL